MTIDWTPERMRERLVRYSELRPCRNAFVDTYTPGSDQKENFTIIGPGVAEHPDQHVHIREPHGFNIGGARQPPGCTNSQHSHRTEEVFVVHTGRWAFRWGVAGEEGEVVLEPGDCISIPVNIFRGFENVGDDIGYLFAVLGGDDPGHVLWAPDVFSKAADHGLILLENGRLVDTTRGETIPEGIKAMPPTTEAQVRAHRSMTLEEMRACVSRCEEQRSGAGSVLSQDAAGVDESGIIGAASLAEGLAAGKMDWPHGFHLRRLDFAAGAELMPHARQEQEVCFLHRGELVFQWEQGEFTLVPGDVLTVPVGLSHSYRNAGTEPALAYIVRGGNAPGAPQWGKRA